jgi:CRP-like cAMP-binding protein
MAGGGVTDIARALAAVPLLADLPAAARAGLAAIARPLRFREAAPIFRAGDPGDGLLLVQDGVVRLHIATPAGREMSLGLIGPGEPLGEIALIDGGPRSADATALTPVRALLLPGAAALPVIAADPAAALVLLRALAARLRRTTAQLEGVALRPLPQRLAAALLKLSAADPAGLVRLSQGHLAGLVAATRPKVNAALVAMRAAGLIGPSAAGLRVLDPAGLAALAEPP